MINDTPASEKRGGRGRRRGSGGCIDGQIQRQLGEYHSLYERNVSDWARGEKEGSRASGDMLGRYVKIDPVTYDRLLLSGASGLKNMVSATDTMTYIAFQARANHNCLPLFSYPACKLVWHSVGKGYELFRKGNRECGKCGHLGQWRPSFWRD